MTDRTPDTDRTQAVQDLRATSDSIRADLRRLAEIEERKARLEAADPETDRLSAEAVELSERIERQTRAERQIAAEIH